MLGSSRTAYRYIAPILVLEVLLVLVPLGIGFWYSLHRADYFQITAFRGLDNYRQVLSSTVFLESVIATTIFSLGALFLTFVVGFALAIRLEQDSRLNVFLRAVVLVPYIIAMLVGSLLLKWIFSTDGGIAPMLLGPLGMADTGILADQRTAMGALIFNGLWRDCGFAMILLMAGLKGIPLELYAAARVDGASAWMRFRTITLPLMRIPIFITLVRLLIHYVNVLTFALVLTGGGPNNSTLTMGLTMYRMGFVDYRIGQANALSLMVFAFNLVLIFALLRLFAERRSGAA